MTYVINITNSFNENDKVTHNDSRDIIQLLILYLKCNLKAIVMFIFHKIVLHDECSKMK